MHVSNDMFPYDLFFLWKLLILYHNKKKGQSPVQKHGPPNKEKKWPAQYRSFLNGGVQKTCFLFSRSQKIETNNRGWRNQEELVEL